jgi:uncharacterized protein YerC
MTLQARALKSTLMDQLFRAFLNKAERKAESWTFLTVIHTLATLKTICSRDTVFTSFKMATPIAATF